MSKIKPFYVYNPTKAEAIEIVKRIVANGGNCYDAVSLMEAIPNGGFYPNDCYECWGYRAGYGSYTGTNPSEWDAERLNMAEVRAMLPCEKYDGKSEWDGEGLPPVGTVCELWWGGSYDEDIEIIQYRRGGDQVVFWRNGKDSVDSAEIPTAQFRPPRTKRDKWIDRIIEIIGNDATTTEETLGRIYDAGLVKDIDE